MEFNSGFKALIHNSVMGTVKIYCQNIFLIITEYWKIGACSTHETNEKFIKTLIEKLKIPRRLCENNIKMGLEIKMFKIL